MAIVKHRMAIARFLNSPWVQPSLPVKRTGVSGHVWGKAHVSAAKVEFTAANAVHIRDQWKAACAERVLKNAWTAAQYRAGRAAIPPFESRNRSADRRAQLQS